jgi:Methylamine utilisation protein MauE
MLGPLAIVAPIVMAAVLIASAIGKLRHPDDLAGWSEIGVPKPLRKEWIRRAHPWGELALGVALVLLGGILGLLAALVALALMSAYLWLVWRSVARADDASCACFGVRKRVTKVTVARNAWLTLLAALTAAVIWTTPTFGGALAAAAALSAWLWLLAAAIAVVSALFVVWPEGGDDEPAAPVAPTYEGGADDDEELDYIRTRTPAVPLTLADGTTVNLRTLVARPLLLLSVSSTCGGCEPVIERIAEWRELLPELDIRLLLFFPPDADILTERTEPQSLHDTNGYVSESLSDHWMTPTAVLLGIDGLLAGGPVVGYLPITEFISDINESLHPAPVQ